MLPRAACWLRGNDLCCRDKSHARIVCDTAHNKEGLTYVLNQLQEEKFDQLHIVLGMVNDKDLPTILPMFPKNALYYFCKPDIPRGLEVAILYQEAQKFDLKGNVYVSVMDAFNSAKSIAQKNDLIFAGGSTFVVAELPLL